MGRKSQNNITSYLFLLILGENPMPFKAGDEALPGAKQVLFCGGKNVMI
jgi:hypothetical protein